MTHSSTEGLIDISRPDSSAVLHHIDKLYSTQTRIWESLNRIMLTQMILSAILIALSSKVISLDEVFEVTGLKFKISLTVILSGGAFAITALSAAFLSQWNQSDAFGLKIKSLYKSIGYQDLLEDEVTDAFEMPGFPMSILTTASAALGAPQFSYGTVWRHNSLDHVRHFSRSPTCGTDNGWSESLLFVRLALVGGNVILSSHTDDYFLHCVLFMTSPYSVERTRR